MSRAFAAGLLAALVLAAALALPMAAQAGTIYVSVVGSDTAGDGSFGNPYATVQHAIDSTSSAADVLVGAGTFSGDVVMKSGVSLYGSGAGTTLLGTGAGPVVSASADATLSGFTITGGDGGFSAGGGIQCSYSSGSTIADCTITGNSSHFGGGGICTYMASPLITRCVITGNSANPSGGGIYCNQGAPIISEDTITANTAASYGGGISSDSSAMDVHGCTIRGNQTTYADGGGIFCLNAGPSIANNVISGNSAGRYGGGIALSNSSPDIRFDTIVGNAATSGGGIYSWQGFSGIENCILWDNDDDLTNCWAVYSDISDAGDATGSGDISAAPSFVDTAAGDFHLAAGSPCIDAASASGSLADKDGVTRPQGAGYDMGAYEFVFPPLTLRYLAGPGGAIVGSDSQSVSYGGSGSAVVASPTVGHHFVKWSDDSTESTRTDANVTADATYTADFPINTYTLRYGAGAHGTIRGSTSQTVDYGGSGTCVTATPTPNSGYRFDTWSDGIKANPRTDVNVTADTSVTASFVPDIKAATITRVPNVSAVTYARKKGVAKFTLSAVIKGWSNKPVANFYITLQTSTNGRSWSTVQRLKTSSAGKASKAFAVKAKQVRYYRWYVPAKPGACLATYSKPTKVTVK